MYAKTYLILTLFLSLLLVSAHGQSRQELEEKRNELLKEIEETSKQLEDAQADRKQALSRYVNLQKQVRNRERLIVTLREETKLIQESIQRTTITVDDLQQDISDLKSEYAQTLRTAYRVRLNRSLLLFLLSSNSVNEAVQRWQYIRQYERYRSRQAELIETTQETLTNKISSLAQRKWEKENLMVTQQRQKEELNKELSERDKILKGLRQDEKNLASQLQKKRDAESKLSETIAEVIRKEIASQSSAELERPSSAPERIQLSENFAENRGSLPWPVNRGTVSRPYGTQDHPTLKDVKVTNNGIDITTDPGAEVFAVFTGKVVSSSFIPGYQNTIILKHGDYYSVYSNLSAVSVRRGQDVQSGQLIGQVGEAEPEVHFELWQEKKRMDPGKWIQSR